MQLLRPIQLIEIRSLSEICTNDISVLLLLNMKVNSKRLFKLLAKRLETVTSGSAHNGVILLTTT